MNTSQLNKETDQTLNMVSPSQGLINRSITSIKNRGQIFVKKLKNDEVQNSFIIKQQPLPENLLPKRNPDNLAWPFFKVDQISQKSFWNKSIKQFFNKQYQNDYIFEGQLLRIGKQKKTPKGYYYQLSNDGILFYYKKKFDDYPKGFLQITFKMRIVLFHQESKDNEQILQLCLQKNISMSIILFDKDNQSTHKFFQIISQFCFVKGFNQMYVLQGPLGRGGFATVYKVQRENDGDIFAAKVYEKDFFEKNSHKSKFLEMVYNEIQCLKRVFHPGIMKLYEIYQEKERFIIILEYIKGNTLSYYIRNQKINTEQKILFILKSLVAALQELHKNGYIHRDIKVENIMIDLQTNNVVKLIDFGFAEKMNPLALLSKSGTCGYLPPEIFRLQPFTFKGDIFSLGVVLFCVQRFLFHYFKMVTQSQPFYNLEKNKFLKNNKYCQISFEDEKWDNYSPDIKKLANAMLQKNPKNRIDIEELIQNPKLQSCSQTEFQSPSIRKIIEFENESRKIDSLVWSSKYSQFYGSNSGQLLEIDINDEDDFQALNEENLLFLEQSYKIFNRQSKS